ncbi:MAG: hypothetical protein PHS82_01815 [Lachnospiraceae bacterium]|nr:hypothetical protein [Lachnospiraceae bacterium]
MEFFDLDISLNKKVQDLTFIQRLQIELLHAVAAHHRLIIVSNVNGKLQMEERQELEQLYSRMTRIGYSICQIESLKNISLDKLDYVQIIDKGKCIEELSRPEIDYSEISRLVNRNDDAEKYSELEKYKNTKLYSDLKSSALELNSLCYGQLKSITLNVLRGDIIKINCKDSSSFRDLKEILTGKAPGAAGQILYYGIPIKNQKYKRKITKHEIACVDYSKNEQLMFENLTIIENVSYPLCLRKSDFFLHKRYIKAVESYIKMITPDLNLNKKVKYLSKEQIMRLVLCKWVLCKPKLLLIFIPSVLTKDGPDFIMDRIILELNKYGIPIIIVSEHSDYKTEVTEKSYVLKEGILCRNFQE